jgi:thiol-disulfide isomerase/thioredoxin
MRIPSLRRLMLTFLLGLTTVAGDAAFAVTLKPWTQGTTPSLALKDLQGHPRSLSEFRGKVVIVNFWATWCEPCIEEMPSLQKFKDRLADEKVEVIGVNLGEGEVRIKSFTDKTGIRFPILLDRDGVAQKSWKVIGVPATFVLDAHGRIRYSYTGVLDFSDEALNTQIRRLLPRKTVKKKT